MHIAILSRMDRSYSTRRLREAAQSRGHQVQVFDTIKFSILAEQARPGLFYGHRALPSVNAAIPRIGASITVFGLAVVRQFEQMGIPVLNDANAIAQSRDKLRAVQIFSRCDIGIPPTAFVRDQDDLLPAIARVGGVPVIIKLLEGTQGVGVILAETETAAEAIIQTLHSARQNVLIQKFVKESRGRDIRAFVVGERVIAAMRRCAQPGEFRSNVHRGGMIEPVRLDPEYEHTAVRAVQIMGLRVAGVDMLESDSGPLVLEVNPSPGLEGIELATGVDVAGAVIGELERHVQASEADARQRIALSGGYGIVEFAAHDMPGIENMRLCETPLAAHNIRVLSITRHDRVMPNPAADDEIRAGDLLLCYGDLLELQSMMPEPQPGLGNSRRKTGLVGTCLRVLGRDGVATNVMLKNR